MQRTVFRATSRSKYRNVETGDAAAMRPPGPLALESHRRAVAEANLVERDLLALRAAAGLVAEDEVAAHEPAHEPDVTRSSPVFTEALAMSQTRLPRPSTTRSSVIFGGSSRVPLFRDSRKEKKKKKNLEGKRGTRLGGLHLSPPSGGERREGREVQRAGARGRATTRDRAARGEVRSRRKTVLLSGGGTWSVRNGI